MNGSSSQTIRSVDKEIHAQEGYQIGQVPAEMGGQLQVAQQRGEI